MKRLISSTRRDFSLPLNFLLEMMRVNEICKEKLTELNFTDDKKGF